MRKCEQFLTKELIYIIIHIILPRKTERIDSMKTTVKKMDYEKVMALPRPEHKLPRKVGMFWRVLIRLLTIVGMAGTGFRYETEGFEKIDRDEPCLVLMNHTCFQDMEVAYRILFPRPFNIVCSNDGFIGFFGLMGWLMRTIGCIPTQKFVSDVSLIGDMEYCFKTLKSSVLMYPEACYSFDGTATTLPRKMGILLKKFDVPVIMIETFGAFGRNPLYNELQIRKHVPITAKARVLFTREEIREKKVSELSEGVEAAFGFDHFRWQQEQGLEIHQSFRADGLHRILYKCVDCGAEGQMVGKGTGITCGACGRHHELTPLGQLEASDGQTKIPHIPDYYRWEREQVRQEILDGTYLLDADVEIAVQVDYRAIYKVGEGHLVHNNSGFHLTSCDGKLDYSQPPQACFGLYADYYWYEMGDVICIGDTDVHYFCFPKNGESVAKIRLATEEMYKLFKARKLPESK